MHRLIPIMIMLTVACQNTSLQNSDPSPPDHPEPYLRNCIATGMNERDITFSPDGKKAYFSVWSGNAGTIMQIKQTGNQWSKPETAPFSGVYSDLEPFITPDGKQLFFASNRPLNQKGKFKDYDIWVMERSENEWGAPVNLGEPVNSVTDEFYPSVTRQGILYFTGKRGDLKDEDIFRCQKPGGGYACPERLGPAINSAGPEFNALIAPDESFLIFSSWGRKDGPGGGDLYIAFRSGDNTWTPAVNMGPAVNSAAMDYCPALGTEGSAFFFTSRRTQTDTSEILPRSYQDLLNRHNSPQNGNTDIYWMDASVIDSMKKSI
ncbi:PD40 domain-containing protein [bacterium]|nr:PD40 domain-containing protein [bacterium]